MLTDRLIKRITELNAPIVVGLDPRLDSIPSYIKEEAARNWRDKLNAAAEAIGEFNKQIIDEICDIVPAVKPQIAMYEQFGAAGLYSYLYTVEYAKSKGLFVIGDIKRGDIASTAEAYSNAHIGRVNIRGEEIEVAQTDYITINPYMGVDSVEPYLSDCEKYDKGLFILVKTSNKGSADIQDLVLANGKPLYAHVGQLVATWGANFIGECGYSNIGAVVGATHPGEAAELRKIMPNTFFLVPGYGTQGGSGKDLKNVWAKNFGAIVNNSRGITGAYLTEKYKCDEKDFAKASRQAVLDMKADLGAYIS
jgi:orotidine-5'-phosphate decarboxylase